MNQVPIYAWVGLALVLGLFIGWFLHKNRIQGILGNAALERDRLIAEGRRNAENLLKEAKLEAKDEFFNSRKAFEKETEQTRQDLTRRTSYLDQRDASLNKKIAFVDEKETRLEKGEQQLKTSLAEMEASKAELADTIEDQNRKLEHIAGLSSENARQMLMENMMSEARLSAARHIQEIRDESERNARRESQRILSLAIQRYAAEHVAETTVSVVDLPNDDMKGRIIGREGRNIRSFELATGVDVIIDDTPEAVIISGFDPVRREIACIALQRLIRDGRIHPGRIEEIVTKTSEEMSEKIRELGEQACLDLDLPNINPELYPYIGRLHYRTSYGQNLLLHSKEVAAISAVVAVELGLDQKIAKRCGFLHDLGKAAEHEFEGPHAMIGGKLARKHGESDIVINAIAGHHQDIEAESPYTFITAAADAVSASRPGARRESIDNYIKRLESLERIAESFDGVEKSFAIQAGREVRILVNHNMISDAEAALLADEVGKRVEGELEYPGQIKIMVIRETRAVSYAR